MRILQEQISAHADGDAVAEQHPREAAAGELRALVGVECNGQVKPDTFSDSFPIKIPFILQRGLIT